MQQATPGHTGLPGTLPWSHAFEQALLAACRLRNGPGEVFGIQFATGLLLRGGSLYISYGITDCFAALVVVKDFPAKLRLWEEFGIGSQGR